MFCATLSHETNRFSPIPTDIDSFREFYLYLPSTGEGAQVLDDTMEGVNLFQSILRRGHDVVCGLAASAQPSMPTIRGDYELLRDELLDNLRAALPVDAVVLFMHGAQLAEGYDDCEGDVLERVRQLVGPDVPIGVEFDLHGNVTQAMFDNADILMACKEYPHIDFEERAEQLIELMERTVRGEIRPVMHLQRVPMLGTYFTTREPMRGFVDEVAALEDATRLLSISLCHGFAWNDIADAGACVIAVSNGDEQLAQATAEGLGNRWFALRERIATRGRSIEDALDQALAAPRGPVVIADMPDNPGGGAPGDSTFLLRAMLERGVTEAALAMIWDPMAVQLARRAGVGAEVPLRIGGKTGPSSGPPLDVMARVTALRDDAEQNAQGMRVPLGPAAAIQVDGVSVVLNSLRNQTFSPECFTELGIDPRDKRILVVKSHQHFHEHFAAMASEIIYATPPGTVDMSFRHVVLDKVRRPIWPLDPVPFEAYGKRWEDQGATAAS
jgi:microcystin degradation protein MlrC